MVFYRAYSKLRWPASTQIYGKKRNFLKHPQDLFGTQTSPPFHCFGTPILPQWHLVNTLYTGKCLISQRRQQTKTNFFPLRVCLHLTINFLLKIKQRGTWTYIEAWKRGEKKTTSGHRTRFFRHCLALTQLHNKLHTIEPHNSAYIDLVYRAPPQYFSKIIRNAKQTFFQRGFLMVTPLGLCKQI